MEFVNGNDYPIDYGKLKNVPKHQPVYHNIPENPGMENHPSIPSISMDAMAP